MDKRNNKMIKSSYLRWKESKYHSIWDAYEKPSIRKEEAWNYCEDLCKKYNGRDLRVISKNIYIFTAGFIGIVDGKEAFVLITANRDEYMILEEK